MDWSGVDYLWIIVMFLSAVWTLILTAPIHCRGFIGEQHFSKSDEETNLSKSRMAWGWGSFQQMFISGWTIPLKLEFDSTSKFIKLTIHFHVWTRGLHGSKNSYPNPKRPVNMLHGTDPDPYFIWKWDPNPCRPEKCHKCTTRTRHGPDHYSKVGPETGWEDTDPTVPVPIGTYCTANAIKSMNKLRKKKNNLFALLLLVFPDCDAYNPPCQ